MTHTILTHFLKDVANLSTIPLTPATNPDHIITRLEHDYSDYLYSSTPAAYFARSLFSDFRSYLNTISPRSTT